MAFTAVSTLLLQAFASLFLSTVARNEHEEDLLNDLHPMTVLLSFPAAKSDPDTMTLDKALREPDAAEFIKAMEQEVADHIKRGHWEVVPFPQFQGGTNPS